MVVYIKSAMSNDDPIFMFFNLVELDNQLPVNIVDKLLACLHKCGFDEIFLQKNWVSFVSDGASALLELAVNNSVKDVTATNHFKVFLDNLYALVFMKYTDLDIFLKVSRVLDVVMEDNH
ncbi:hypothetical protein QTP88_020044 [Uroleucon formosanum]